eukprot:scaffold578989_cov17-Prasinocladus_malaysianus.AAC.1
MHYIQGLIVQRRRLLLLLFNSDSISGDNSDGGIKLATVSAEFWVCESEQEATRVMNGCAPESSVRSPAINATQPTIAFPRMHMYYLLALNFSRRLRALQMPQQSLMSMCRNQRLFQPLPNDIRLISSL